MASRPRVLVTRPEPGATETAGRLAALGYEPVKLPLQETRPLPVNVGAVAGGGRPPLRLASQATSPPLDGGEEEGRHALVSVSSASAIRHAPPGLLELLVGLPCFTVGEATAKAARAAGFRKVNVAGGDAEGLADAIVAARPAGAVAYLCGRVRRPVFEERLTQAGIAVVAIETYDTAPLEPEAGVAAGNPVDFILVHSANAASRLAGMDGPDGMVAGATFVCISPRVAEVLGRAGRKILVAREPNETALLKLLGDAVKPAS